MVFPSKLVVICCPVSGKHDAVVNLETAFFPRCKELGLNVELVLTERAGHATELAKKHAQDGAGLILVGGDGTIHEGMDGLIQAGLLKSTTVGLLSQGTMNNYYHSGQLPSMSALPDIIARKSSRFQSLMRVKDNSGKINTLCFEAIYLGVGYAPAKGAQVYRHSLIGSFGGIMKELIYANMFPATASVSGTLTVWPKSGGAPVVLQGTFFWIVVCQRNPYNGVLERDSTWVSYLSLDKFPGFGRMMDAFTPPMEFIAGLSTMMEGHIECTRLKWEQERKDIGVCLDGDPTDGGRVLEVEHVKEAWTILAEPDFPSRLPDRFFKERPITKEAREWLNANPPAKNVYFPSRAQWENPQSTKTKKGISPLFVAAALLGVGFLAYYLFASERPDAINVSLKKE